MRRLLGLKKKRRLTPRGKPPGDTYNYAMHEYRQTVAPETSNDAGTISEFADYKYGNSRTGVELGHAEEPTYQKMGGDSSVRDNRASGLPPYPANSTSSSAQPPMKPQHAASQPSLSERQTSRRRADEGSKRRPLLSEPEMPDTTYEEEYGDAYVGGTIKYVYPSGYQSMRPRGGPWKLSLVICVLFTWLSVFIVGHCSDRVAEDQSYQANEIDDDALVIETRWCGSRPLYIMWVMSMLVTGLAMAYCSVIGYIKVRDFAVANSRSQPPGMMGKSDYYVRLGDDPHDEGGSVASQSSSLQQYQRTIYQSDGTPAFWGGHIYRPTQAAVAVTSR